MAKAASIPVGSLGGTPGDYNLKDLLLDKDNPRFGFPDTKPPKQADVLDYIVEKFGVDDVLSSLAVNGYFAAEPMVCRLDNNGKNAVVVEGNRRLAACLILVGDPRASHQANRTAEFQPIWIDHGRKTIDPVPVIAFQGKDTFHALLSYLGVRHIASSQPWDSYAKAAWVAKVVEENELDLKDVALMIGDQHRTIERLLEGFYFVRQLIDDGAFSPEDSQRRGRGSVTEYPFSWIYTLLGYSATRNFLGLTDTPVKPKPLSKRNLSKAALVTTAMFGDKSRGRSAAIDDSRQLGQLASALASPEKVTLLEQGKSIEQIERATQPLDERLRRGLATVREIQSDLISGMSEQPVPSEIAAPLINAATMNRRSATELEKRLREAGSGEAGDE